MKKNTKIVYLVTFLILVLLLVGCSNDSNEDVETDVSGNDTALESNGETDDTQEVNLEEEEKEVNSTKTKESQTVDSNKTETNNEVASNSSSKEKTNPLAAYSAQEIEYARVWLQLGPNQDLEELYVQHIPAGTPLNPDDDIDVSYPEDVIQLTGGRIVDGIVTYSGNGDGTINVYNVPRRWYGGFPPPEDIDKDAVREDMEDIINNTKQDYVDRGNDDEIVRLINIMTVE